MNAHVEKGNLPGTSTAAVATAATTTPARAAAVTTAPTAAPISTTTTATTAWPTLARRALALAREAVGTDVAEGGLHWIGLGTAATLVVATVTSVVAALAALVRAAAAQAAGVQWVRLGRSAGA